ncbi:MAG TPA: hypothetical protein VKZ97_00720 [Flavobacteriaceae bacterium]|nr:hypothetical protein [Flavobacteriaceae bacterium]
MFKLIGAYFFISFCLNAQTSSTPYPDFIGQTFSEIAQNPEWLILKETQGDLNHDSKPDYVLVLEAKDSIVEKFCEACKNIKSKPRILLVLIDQNGEKRSVIQNNKFIARGNEGGMLPYLEPDISIKDSALTIYYQYTRGNQSYTFEYVNKDFVITRAESHDVHATTGNMESHKFDFRKKILVSEYGNISEQNSKSESIKLEVESRSLSDFKEMYDWEVAPNIYL